MRRELLAWIDDQLVGRLADENGIWSFQYESGWQTFGLCPQLPLQPEPLIDGSSQRPVQWYFDNLLPEEGQRQLLAQDARLEAADAFALLSWYGAESAGSLTLLAEGQRLPPGDRRPLSDADLSRRIKAMPQLPLTHEAHKRMSLAGAQHKLAVILDEQGLQEPVGALPSTHILKPDHPHEAFAHSVINEWFTMRLAGMAGLIVPAVERRYVPEPVYLIERFDRVRTPGGWQRRHGIDACQVLGLDRHFKYQAGSVERLAELARLCEAPAVTRTRLFNWLAFNVLVGNTDAHLKNLGFLVSPRGLALAPCYDLLCTAVYESRAFDQQRWPQPPSPGRSWVKTGWRPSTASDCWMPPRCWVSSARRLRPSCNACASACPPRLSSCWNRPSGRIRFWPPRDRSCGQSSPASCAACGRSGR